MITPMIREIRRTYPGSFIAAMTNANSADVLTGNPHLNEIIIDEPSEGSFLKTVNKLRNLRFSDGLLVMPTERAAYQMFLAGVRNRIGVGRKPYEVITFMKSVSRNKYVPLRHEADYCMDLARAIGVVPDDLRPEIFVSYDERMRGQQLLTECGSKQHSRRIIVHTGSGGSSRNWSEAKYFELTGRLLGEFQDTEIVLTAQEMSDEFADGCLRAGGGRAIDARGAIKRLRDLVQIISNADLLIASSTGPLHVASALGIKTIGLYCYRPMNCARHWGALGEKAVNLEISRDYCDSNCSQDKESCMFEGGITVEEVLDHARPLI